MENRGNIFDLTTRRRAKKTVSQSSDSNAPVLDMIERRDEILDSEKREVKRTILTEFIGAFAVVPELGLMKVAIHDISDSGLAFDLDAEVGKFREGEQIAFRVYLNHKTYFPFTVKVSNHRELTEENTIRHGASFVKGTVNETALNHFVSFIESVSANLETDKGDVMVSNLNK